MSSLKGKTVLITGASAGIGEGTALHFASLGCKLSLHGRNADNLRKVAAKCHAAGLAKSQVLCVLGDFTDQKAIEKVMRETVQHFGQLDVLVNNAGIFRGGSLESHTLADYDLLMNVNGRAVFYLSQLAVPHLAKTKGTIVNVSSVYGSRSFDNTVGYCMSKAIVDQLTRCSALDLAPKGIRVNSVNPGIIKTDIFRNAGIPESACIEILEHSKTTHALGRIGETDEVAKAIAFLASDDASFITGATLSIDGGRAVMCPR